MGVAKSAAISFTYDDYLQWADDDRWELVGGVPFNMSPAPGRRHQEVVGELYRQLADALLGQSCRVYVAPFDLRLPASPAEADATIVDVVQPDLLVVCDAAKLDERGCRGAPDLIIEVISPRSAARDLVTKRDLYARHGVPEYWVVHPTDGILTLHRRPAEGRYMETSVEEATGHRAIGVLPGVVIDWGRLG
jgi:Uma2 family endonuclease